MTADGVGAITCVIGGGPFPCGTAAAFLDAGNTGSGASLINGVSGNVPLAPGATPLTVVVPFDTGNLVRSNVIELPVAMSLSAQASCTEADDDTCNAFADFSNTVFVTSVSVLGVNMNPVPGAIITAASGTNYDDIQVAPEPSSFGMLLAVLVGFIVWTRAVKNRKRCRP